LVQLKWKGNDYKRSQIKIHFKDGYSVLWRLVKYHRAKLQSPGAKIIWLRSLVMKATGGRYSGIYDNLAGPLLENGIVAILFSGNLFAWAGFVAFHIGDVVLFGVARLRSAGSNRAPPVVPANLLWNVVLSIALASFNFSLGYSPLDSRAIISHLLLNFSFDLLWSFKPRLTENTLDISNRLQQRLDKHGLADLAPIGSLGLNLFGKVLSLDRSRNHGLIVLNGKALGLSSKASAEKWQMEHIRLTAVLLKTRSVPCDILVDEETKDLAESVVNELKESNSLTFTTSIFKKSNLVMAALSIEDLKRYYTPRFMLVPEHMLVDIPDQKMLEGVFALETFVPISEAIKNIGQALRLILTAA
jgi:hypothetical protein